jgi:hypothetical protein
LGRPLGKSLGQKEQWVGDLDKGEISQPRSSVPPASN